MSDGLISVVVHASPDFSPSSLNVNSLALGPGSATPVSTSWADVNGDGLTDLILQFRVEATGIACGETALHLSGRTLDERFASGWAAVKSISCR